MKKAVIIVLTLVMMMGLGIGSASAANSLKAGTIGLNFDVNKDFMLTGKYLITNSIAVLAGVGFAAQGGDTGNGTDIAVLAGVRKYLNTDDLAPFVGGLITYRSTTDSTVKDLAVMAQAGAEYFLARQFSIEGSIGFGYSSNEVGNVKNTTLGTGRAGLSVNFYF